VTRYRQFDVFTDTQDALPGMRLDEDGDTTMHGTTDELMAFREGVRILIPVGLSYDAALRTLKKAPAFIEKALVLAPVLDEIFLLNDTPEGREILGTAYEKWQDERRGDADTH
jgi:hypothetical protein